MHMDAKAYVLLVAIRLSNGWSPWSFSKRVANADIGFLLRPSSRHIYHSYITPQCNTHKYTHPRHFPIHTVTHHQGLDFDDMSSFFPCDIYDAIQYINIAYGAQAPKIVFYSAFFHHFVLFLRFRSFL